MYAEYLGFIGFFILIVYGYGALAAKPEHKAVANILASIFLLVMSMFIFADGVQFQSGQTVQKSINETSSGGNTTGNDTESISYTYTSMSSPTDNVMPIKNLLAMFMALIALTGIYMNAID